MGDRFAALVSEGTLLLERAAAVLGDEADAPRVDRDAVCDSLLLLRAAKMECKGQRRHPDDLSGPQAQEEEDDEEAAPSSPRVLFDEPFVSGATRAASDAIEHSCSALALARSLGLVETEPSQLQL